MNQTPLHERHIAKGAKLVDFAGWEMPIHYTGVVDEYRAVRTTAGLFDVSHMGRILVSGENAQSFLQYVTTNDVSRLTPLQSHYSMLCNTRGGIKDDIFVYRVEPQEFLLCVNASNREKILPWLSTQQEKWTHLTVLDRTRDLAQLALQGPASPSIVSELAGFDLSSLKPRHCVKAGLAGESCLVTRTGYTGEIGYELYVPVDQILTIWDRILNTGEKVQLKPVGLGARDLLRLEMAYLLYGNDISEDTTPFEAGAQGVVSLTKGDFIGRETLAQQQQSGVAKLLTAFELIEKAVPRHGYKVYNANGHDEAIGEVTSGTLSPLMQKGMGMAYLPPHYSTPGVSLMIDIRGKRVPGVVVRPPFYKKTKSYGQ